MDYIFWNKDYLYECRLHPDIETTKNDVCSSKNKKWTINKSHQGFPVQEEGG